jgi:hypothetical protein
MFGVIAAGGYEVSVKAGDAEWRAGTPLVVKDASPLTFTLGIWDHQQNGGDIAADSVFAEGALLSGENG